MSKFYQRHTKAAKLTASKVTELRELYATGKYSQGELGRMFGIGMVQVGRIVRGECWVSLPVLPSKEEIEESEVRFMQMMKAEGLVPKEDAASSAEKMMRAVAESKEQAAQADLMLEGLKTNLPLSEEVAKKAKEFLG